MTIFVIAVVAIGLVSLYLFNSLGIMDQDKFGVKIVLGKIKETINLNWYFAPKPFVKVIKITKELMMFKFTVKTVVTRKGKINGYGDKEIDPVEVDVKCTVYAQFDETDPNHIVQYSPGYDAQKLGPFLVPYSADTVRALAGRLPWRLLNRERYKSSAWVQARLVGGKYYGINDDDPDGPIFFKTNYTDSPTDNDDDKKNDDKNKPLGQMPEITNTELEGKSPFVMLHLKNVSFVIEDLCFSESVRKSIVAPEKAQLDGEAMIITAKATKQKKIEEGQGDADARGAMLDKIKVDKDLEALNALKEIGKGPSNFIFSLPESLQKIISKINS